MEDYEYARVTFDAFTGGVADGGLRSVAEIHLLVCYVLAHTKKPVTERVLMDTIVGGEMANYFETASALEYLKKEKLIITDENENLIPSDNCKRYISLVEEELPYTIRKRSLELSTKLAIKAVFEKDNKVEITKIGENYNISMHVNEGDTDFMVINLTTPSASQAELVKDLFYMNPINVYESVVNAIFNNKLPED